MEELDEDELNQFREKTEVTQSEMEQEPTPGSSGSASRSTLDKWCDGTEWSARAKWYVRGATGSVTKTAWHSHNLC